MTLTHGEALPTLGHMCDRHRLVDETGHLVAQFPPLGHRVENVIATLARAVLRGDADFHAYQMLVFEEPEAAISP